MSKVFDNQKIENQQWKDAKIEHHEFDNCTFHACDFSGALLFSSNFVDCQFFDCNFAMTNLANVLLHGVKFHNCKVLGVQFNLCNDFIFDVCFQDSILDYSSFGKRKMPKTVFTNCSLKGVDFIDAQLKQAKFVNPPAGRRAL